MNKQDNIHINYEITAKVYHRKIANLADKYTPIGGTVLDIGCGSGHVLVDLQKQRPDLVLDIADAYESALALTRQRVPAIRYAYRIPDRDFDISAITQRDYDTCIMSHVLEHIPVPLKALQMTMDLLKPDGKLILAVPNPVNPVNFLLAGLRIYRANPGHCFHWDRGHWKNFLENVAELHVLEYGHDEAFLFPRRFPRNTPLKRLEELVGLLFPGWTFSNLAVVTRRQK